MKKAFILLLTLILVVSLLCMPAFAQEDDAEIAGQDIVLLYSSEELEKMFHAAQTSTAPADAFVNEDGSKTWYVDGVKHTEHPPVHLVTVVDFPSELEDYEVVVEKIEGDTPWGPVSDLITVRYHYALYDADNTLAARYIITVCGTYSPSALRGEIDSVSCAFTYTMNSHFSADASADALRIYLDNFCVKLYGFTMNADGSITVT